MKRKPRIVKCNRCGFEWVTRLRKDPKRCSRCKSPYWNIKRTRKKSSL